MEASSKSFCELINSSISSISSTQNYREELIDNLNNPNQKYFDTLQSAIFNQFAALLNDSCNNIENISIVVKTLVAIQSYNYEFYENTEMQCIFIVVVILKQLEFLLKHDEITLYTPVNEIVDDLLILCQKSDEDRKKIIACILQNIFKEIHSTSTMQFHKMIIQAINNEINLLDLESRTFCFQKIEPFLEKIVAVFKACGDFDFQSLILEMLFILKIDHYTLILQWFQEDDLKPFRKTYRKFQLDDNFDFHLRKLINQFNLVSGKIFSIVCQKIYVQNIAFIRPKTAMGYSEFWIDFSLELKSVFFCYDRSTFDLQHETTWGSITLPFDIISEVVLEKLATKKGNRVKLKIETVYPFLVTNKEDRKLLQNKSVTIIFKSSEETAILEQYVLPSMYGNRFKIENKKKKSRAFIGTVMRPQDLESSLNASSISLTGLKEKIGNNSQHFEKEWTPILDADQSLSTIPEESIFSYETEIISQESAIISKKSKPYKKYFKATISCDKSKINSAQTKGKWFRSRIETNYEKQSETPKNDDSLKKFSKPETRFICSIDDLNSKPKTTISCEENKIDQTKRIWFRGGIEASYENQSESPNKVDSLKKIAKPKTRFVCSIDDLKLKPKTTISCDENKIDSEQTKGIWVRSGIEASYENQSGSPKKVDSLRKIATPKTRVVCSNVDLKLKPKTTISCDENKIDSDQTKGIWVRSGIEASSENQSGSPKKVDSLRKIATPKTRVVCSNVDLKLKPKTTISCDENKIDSDQTKGIWVRSGIEASSENQSGSPKKVDSLRKIATPKTRVVCSNVDLKLKPKTTISCDENKIDSDQTKGIWVRSGIEASYENQSGSPKKVDSLRKIATPKTRVVCSNVDLKLKPKTTISCDENKIDSDQTKGIWVRSGIEASSENQSGSPKKVDSLRKIATPKTRVVCSNVDLKLKPKTTISCDENKINSDQTKGIWVRSGIEASSENQSGSTKNVDSLKKNIEPKARYVTSLENINLQLKPKQVKSKQKFANYDVTDQNKILTRYQSARLTKTSKIFQNSTQTNQFSENLTVKMATQVQKKQKADTNNNLQTKCIKNVVILEEIVIRNAHVINENNNQISKVLHFDTSSNNTSLTEENWLESRKAFPENFGCANESLNCSDETSSVCNKRKYYGCVVKTNEKDRVSIPNASQGNISEAEKELSQKSNLSQSCSLPLSQRSQPEGLNFENSLKIASDAQSQNQTASSPKPASLSNYSRWENEKNSNFKKTSWCSLKNLTSSEIRNETNNSNFPSLILGSGLLEDDENLSSQKTVLISMSQDDTNIIESKPLEISSEKETEYTIPEQTFENQEKSIENPSVLAESTANTQLITPEETTSEGWWDDSLNKTRKILSTIKKKRKLYDHSAGILDATEDFQSSQLTPENNSTIPKNPEIRQINPKVSFSYKTQSLQQHSSERNSLDFYDPRNVESPTFILPFNILMDEPYTLAEYKEFLRSGKKILKTRKITRERKIKQKITRVNTKNSKLKDKIFNSVEYQEIKTVTTTRKSRTYKNKQAVDFTQLQDLNSGSNKTKSPEIEPLEISEKSENLTKIISINSEVEKVDSNKNKSLEIKSPKITNKTENVTKTISSYSEIKKMELLCKPCQVKLIRIEDMAKKSSVNKKITETTLTSPESNKSEASYEESIQTQVKKTESKKVLEIKTSNNEAKKSISPKLIEDMPKKSSINKKITETIFTSPESNKSEASFEESIQTQVKKSESKKYLGEKTSRNEAKKSISPNLFEDMTKKSSMNKKLTETTLTSPESNKSEASYEESIQTQVKKSESKKYLGEKTSRNEAKKSISPNLFEDMTKKSSMNKKLTETTLTSTESNKSEASYEKSIKIQVNKTESKKSLEIKILENNAKNSINSSINNELCETIDLTDDSDLISSPDLIPSTPQTETNSKTSFFHSRRVTSKTSGFNNKTLSFLNKSKSSIFHQSDNYSSSEDEGPVIRVMQVQALVHI